MPVEEDIVTNGARISSILKGLVASRSLLTITTEQSGNMLSSTLLEVTDDDMLLDELVQPRREAEIDVGSTISVFSKNKGVPVVFRSEISGARVEDDTTYFQCKIPEYLKYSQKRSSFRLPTHGDTPSVALRLDGKVIGSQTLDISEGGAKIAVVGDEEVVLDSEHEGIIYLDDERMPTAVRICHVRDNYRRGRRELGLEFTSLDSKHRRDLNRWIVMTERSRIRRH